MRCEKILIREFGRKAYLYLPESELPAPGDTLEWLSLMRHHGAPTRLLDWSYSIFVAAFFALASSERGHPCYIWAIDTVWLNDRASATKNGLEKNKNERDKTGSHFREHFINPRDQKAFVSTETPMRLNKRLTMQRGVFLCPGKVEDRFVDNLNGLSDTNERAKHAQYFRIDKGARTRDDISHL